MTQQPDQYLRNRYDRFDNYVRRLPIAPDVIAATAATDLRATNVAAEWVVASIKGNRAYELIPLSGIGPRYWGNWLCMEYQEIGPVTAFVGALLLRKREPFRILAREAYLASPCGAPEHRPFTNFSFFMACTGAGISPYTLDIMALQEFQLRHDIALLDYTLQEAYWMNSIETAVFLIFLGASLDRITLWPSFTVTSANARWEQLRRTPDAVVEEYNCRERLDATLNACDEFYMERAWPAHYRWRLCQVAIALTTLDISAHEMAAIFDHVLGERLAFHVEYRVKFELAACVKRNWMARLEYRDTPMRALPLSVLIDMPISQALVIPERELTPAERLRQFQEEERREFEDLKQAIKLSLA